MTGPVVFLASTPSVPTLVAGTMPRGGTVTNTTKKPARAARSAWVLGCLLAAACGGDSKVQDRQPEQDAQVSGDGGPSSDAGTDGSVPSDSGTDGSTPSDGSTGGDGAAASDSGSAFPEGAPVPEVTAILRQVGRYGADLRIEVTGKAVGATATALRIQLFDAQNAEVPQRDADGDGDADVGAVEYPLSQAISTTQSGSAFVVISGIMAGSKVPDHARYTLVDNGGVASGPLDATIAAQPVRQEGDTCDDTYVLDRCAEGLGCKGTLPKVCSPGEAPRIDLAGYFDDELGGRVLVVGADPDDDLKSYQMRLLNADDSPVVPTEENGIPEGSVVDGTIDVVAQGGRVLLALPVPANIVVLVAKIEVTLTDRGNRASAPMVLTKVAAPLRAHSATCDTRLFDRCPTGDICVAAGGATAGTCVALSAARMSACENALTLTPVDGVASLRATIGLPSLWDVPDGTCSTNNPKTRPERLVKFTLSGNPPKPAGFKVTLSTDHPYTSFDTTLYAMSTCSATPLSAWCVDDQPLGSSPHSERAVLVLDPLPAGTYYVVVDSFPSQGLTGIGFELSLKVE